MPPPVGDILEQRLDGARQRGALMVGEAHRAALVGCPAVAEFAIEIVVLGQQRKREEQRAPLRAQAQEVGIGCLRIAFCHRTSLAPAA